VSPVTRCLFVSDLHGRADRYEKLFRAIESEGPEAVFMGGDLLPSGLLAMHGPEAGGPGKPGAPGEPGEAGFVHGFLAGGFARLRWRMGRRYPRVFLILGNDDGKAEEGAFVELAEEGLWVYGHNRRISFAGHDIYGYSYVPPTPFTLKDWERYDVSRYVDPGCISPEEGWRSVPAVPREVRHATIREDLRALVGEAEVDRAVFLFHTPPYQTTLDRAALDGRTVDHVPVDVHVGSVAVRRFIESCQPLLTLHGHIHESARLTGAWRDRIGRTHMFTGAHDGPELALVRFDLEDLDAATRHLL